MADSVMTPPLAQAFGHVDHWVFDLDNTLYPAACDLFAQIDERMTQFVMSRFSLPRADARALQKKYYVEHGTTLRGLMTVHGMAPDDFLSFVNGGGGDVQAGIMSLNEYIAATLLDVYMAGKGLDWLSGGDSEAGVALRGRPSAETPQ